MTRRLSAKVGLVALCLAAIGTILPFARWRPERPPHAPVEVRGLRWISTEPATDEPRAAVPVAPLRAPRLASERELDRTMRALRRRLAEVPADVEARSNLAFTLAARARELDRPADLLEALEQLESATSLAPERPEVLYNRAEVLTLLGLRDAARITWNRYLQSEPDAGSPWRLAGRDRLAVLETPTLQERWSEEGRRALLGAAAAGDSARTRELVATYAPYARPWIEEELLAAWADAEAEGDADEAAERWRALRVLAHAFAATGGDRSAADTLDAYTRQPAEGRASILEGLRLNGRAMQVYRAFGPEDEKNSLLERAATALERGHAPLAGWPRFYRIVAWHRTQPDLAASRLAELEAEVSPDRQPALLSRIEWLLGTNDVTRNRYERSLEHYEQARALLERSEGSGSAAFMDLLTAEALSKLGEFDSAWSLRISAIQGLAPAGERQRLHAALYSAVEQLFVERRIGAAAPFVHELGANARAWGTAIGTAEASLQAGRFQALRGRTHEAEESFRLAADAAARVEDASLRQRTEATIALYRAEALPDRSAGDVVAALDRARSQMIELGYRYQLPRLDTARAAASLARGDRSTAMAALQSSIAEEERIRADVHDLSWRASAFEGAQRAFDFLVELELGSPDGDRRAFRWAERSRARVLLDLLRDGSDSPAARPRPLDLDELVARMPADTDLVELAVLPDRLVLWWVRRDGSQRFETEVDIRSLETAIDRFRQAIEYGSDDQAVRNMAGTLWDQILGPVGDGLEDGRRLVIVPDRSLGRVPFAALFDRRRGAYLIENHPLTIAPSATAFVAASAESAALGHAPPRSVLAVGTNHPGQAPLPRAATEATAIGGLYPLSTVLTGEAATRGRFLESLDRSEVVHFAGHGEDGAAAMSRSRLFFWPAEPDDPGTLFSGELATRHLRQTRLAVLASCRSVTPSLRGRENVSGLAAAFLAAGVPTVVASLWAADDDATGLVMTAFHRRLRTGDAPDKALQRAQLELAQSNLSYRSPRYWAGFVAVGGN